MPAGILKTSFRWSFSGTILRTDGAILMAGVFDHQRLFLAADEVSKKFLGQIFLAKTKYSLVLAKHKWDQASVVETFPAQQSHETKMSVKARERLMREVGQRTKYKINMTKKSLPRFIWTAQFHDILV